MILLRFKKYLIGGALAISLVGGGYWYITGLHDRITELSIASGELTQENERLGNQMEQNIIDFQNEAERWRTSMDTFVTEIQTNEEKMQSLRGQLREEESEEVKECLYDTRLSDAALERLYDNP